MKSSKALCIIASALILLSFPSCGKDNLNSNGDSSFSYTEKHIKLFTGYVVVPLGEKHIMLRSEPSESSKEVAPLLTNDEVDVIKECDGWYYVVCNDFRGYLKTDYISLNKVITVESGESNTVTSSQTGTTGSTTETETETSTTVTETTTQEEDEDKEDNKEEDKDKNDSEDKNSSNDSHKSENSRTEQKPVSAAEYPSISVSLGIDPCSGDTEKYEFYMVIGGKFTKYKYEAYRMLPDGSETLLSSGESSESRLTLAIHDTLLKSGALDKVKVTPYLNSVEGDPLELEVFEPIKTW